MSKINLNSFNTLQNSSIISNLNANNALLESSIDNTLSRDGASPNFMEADLDMNSFQILNLSAPSTVNSPVRVVDVISGSGAGVGIFFPGIANTWLQTQTFTPSTTVPAIIVNAPNSLSTLSAMTINKGLSGASGLDIKSTDNSGDLLRLYGPNDVLPLGPAQYFTTGGFLSKLFILISGTSVGQNIQFPSNDAGMFSIWADVPKCMQVRSSPSLESFNGGGAALSVLNGNGFYTGSILFDGTLAWGSSTNATFTGQDTFLGRSAPATLQIGGPDVGAPVVQTLGVQSVSVPILANQQFQYGKTFHFAAGVPAGVAPGQVVSDITLPGFDVVTHVASVDFIAKTVTTDNYGHPYQGDVITFNGTNNSVLTNTVSSTIGYGGGLPVGVVVGQLVTDVSIPAAIPGGTVVSSIDTSLPLGSGGATFIVLSNPIDGTIFNTGPGAHDVLSFAIPNTSASDFIIGSGKGTGTGSGGKLRLQVSEAGGAGSTQNSLIDYLVLNPVTKTASVTIPFVTKNYTVATLPTGTAGARAHVTDANATFTAGIGAIVAAGGANVVPVFYDGTNWRIG